MIGELHGGDRLVVRQPVELIGAGRTDAGVHAWGQVVSGDLPDDTDLDDLARRINKLCAPAISVRSAEWAERTTSTPASRPPGGGTATTCGTTLRRTRCSPASAGTCHHPLDLALMQGRRSAR